MKKRGFMILCYWLVLWIVMPFCLLDADSLTGFHVSAREGLSDAELYGNGQESVLYSGSSGKKKSEHSSATSKETKNKHSISDAKSASVVSADGKPKSTASEDSKSASVASENAKSKSAASGDAQADIPISEDTKAQSVSGNALLTEEDIVITGVEPDGIYNRDVTIELSAVRASEAVSVVAELCTVSGDGTTVDEETEGADSYKENAASGEALETEHTGAIDGSRRSQPGLQIGLSAVGQLVSGRQQVSEEGRYELVVWQETNEGQELAKEQSLLKKVGFTVDKTAPIIDRELISRLCKSEIDIEVICKEAVHDESKVTTSCLVNEQELTKGVVNRPGEYELVVNAEDEAGNRVQEQLQITLQDDEEMQAKPSRWMTPSVLVLLFGGSLLLREKRKEKKENEYEQRDK